MAHNDRIRVIGQWVAVTPIDPDELQTFDTRQFESINGDQGGTWAPADEIVIGGLGLGVTGPFSALDATTIAFGDDGLLTFDDAASEEAAIQLGEFRTIELAVDAGIKLASGATITMAAGSSFTMDGVLLVTNGGTSTFQTGTTTTWESGSAFVIASGATAGCATTWAQTGLFARAGATARSTQSGRSVTYTNVNQMIGVEMDFVEFVNTTGAMLTLTLKIATAPVPTVDERIRVRVSGVGAGGKTIVNEGSPANLAIVAGANAANFEFVFDGVAWRVLSNVGAGITLGTDAF